MAKDPAFLFYTADFLTGVVFMTDEEVGKYIKILCLLHQHNGRLEKHKIEKVVGKLSESILEKLDSDSNGCLFNKRLLLETKKRRDYCESRRKNIQKRYKKPTYVEHMNKHMENENENINKDINKDIDLNSKKKSKVYIIPPVIEDVISYCQERKNNVNAEAWYNHYMAKGWFIGKTKMVDWKAAVRTWEDKNVKSKEPYEGV